MYVENPRRLVTFLLLFAGVLFAGWFFLLRDDNGNTDTATAPTTVPVSAAVKRILDASNGVSRVVIDVKDKTSGNSRRVYDVKRSYMAVSYQGKLMEMFKGRTAYTNTGRCYQRNRQPAAFSNMPEFAQEFLPAGSPGVKFTTSGRKLTWKLQGTPYPKGTVTTDSRGRMTSATRESAANTKLTATFSYPQRVPVAAAPRDLCRRGR